MSYRNGNNPYCCRFNRIKETDLRICIFLLAGETSACEVAFGIISRLQNVRVDACVNWKDGEFIVLRFLPFSRVGLCQGSPGGFLVEYRGPKMAISLKLKIPF